jgi:hypothetical protein
VPVQSAHFDIIGRTSPIFACWISFSQTIQTLFQLQLTTFSSALRCPENVDLAIAVWNVANIQQRNKNKDVGELINLTKKVKGISHAVQGMPLDNLLDGHLSMYEPSSTRSFVSDDLFPKIGKTIL